MSKEHWAKRLKRELAEARAVIREISRNPEGQTAIKYRMLTGMEDAISARIWFGGHGGSGTADGLFAKMVASELKQDEEPKP